MTFNIKKQPKMLYHSYKLEYKLPEHIKEKDIQWQGTVRGKRIWIYYDDKATHSDLSNHYAVFSNKGLIGWVQFGFTYPEIENLIKSYKETDYDKGLEEFKKMIEESFYKGI